MKKTRSTREEKMSQIQEQLENGVKEIFTSEKYKEYISAMSKFPSYSLNNCVLIATQCPQATLVCGFKKWQTEFNRSVNKNEHGIMIIAPMKFKADVDEPVYDKNSHPVKDDSGNQVTEKVNREFQSYRPAYVFDVGQTSGDDIPSLVTFLDSGVNDYEHIRDALISISPVPVTFEEITSGANGFFSPTESKIVVKIEMPELQTVKTLIHEIAHAELGHGGKDDKWDRESKEVMAESVAYWVSQMIGLDTSDYSFGYISGWSKNREVSELKENLDQIKAAADKISGNLEVKLKEIKELLASESQEVATTVADAESPKRKKCR